MSQLQPLLDSLYQGNALTREQSAQLFSAIVEGEMDPVAMAGMLVALKMRGETIEEITGAADALRQAAKPFPRSAKSLATGVVDIVGTGGTVITPLISQQRPLSSQLQLAPKSLSMVIVAYPVNLAHRMCCHIAASA